jgi:hypothetical protein
VRHALQSQACLQRIEAERLGTVFDLDQPTVVVIARRSRKWPFLHARCLISDI